MLSADTKGWLFDVNGDIYLPAGGDIRDSTGTSVLDGGVTGLTGNDNYTPTTEGDTKYELNINNDIELKTYDWDDDEEELGPGFSLGSGNGDRHRSGVIAIGNDDVGYNSKRGGVYIGAQAGWNDEEDSQG